MRSITDDEKEELRQRHDVAGGGGCWELASAFAYVVLIPLIAMAITVGLLQRTTLAWIIASVIALALALVGIRSTNRTAAARAEHAAEWNALIDRIAHVDRVELEIASVHREQDGALIESTTGERIFIAPVSLLPPLHRSLMLELARETPLVVSAESEGGDEIEPKHEWPLPEPLVLEWYEEWRRVET
ncbi:MAG TPA: hypothetical protein VMU84_16240 [Thermoanaerobaculia bacterium]|nr:hypothetical protein [Thermoanaerobaculia bacterium]